MTHSAHTAPLGPVLRELSQAELRRQTPTQQHSFFETLLSHLPVKVSVLDEQGRYLYLNPATNPDPSVRAWILGKDDLAFCHHYDYDPDLAHTRRRHFDAACEGRQLVSWEEQLTTPTGARYYWRNYQPVYGAAGDLQFVLGFGRDITENRRVETALARNQARVENILDNLTDAFFALDQQGQLTYLNAKAEELLAQPRATLLGRTFGEVLQSSLGEAAKHTWDAVLSQQTSQVFEQFIPTQQSWLEVHTYPTSEGWAVYLHDVTERRTIQEVLRRAHDELEQRVRARTAELEEAKARLEAINAQLQHDAFHDALTGLPNRALFLDRLAQAVERAKRHRVQGFAVLFLDFDRFKVVNDSLGHAVGDALLIALGERLASCIRPIDTVARLGGDEFTILLTDVPVTSEALRTAERIRTALAEPFRLGEHGEHEVQMSASIGIVPSELGYSSADEVLRDADIAMYRAKLSGKAQHQLFGPAMRDEAVRRLALETDLRAALAHDELSVVYQPITAIATGKPIGFEALVRWAHPRYGNLSPKDFIPLAEETGLIFELDRWVLRRALAQVRGWQRQFPGFPPLTLSTNLSSRQFAHPELASWLQGLLLEHDFAPQNLKLEITENVFMASSEQVIGNLKDLRTLGVQLHIDDFGTGYSSLSYLQHLPVSTLKIDRSFVTQMGDTSESTEIVQTIVAMAKALGLNVTAEGIETRAQLEQLRGFGCEYGQGYLFAEPLSPQETEAFMTASVAEHLQAKPR